MKNTLAVFVDGKEFTCAQWFDSDTNTDGIDIYDEDGKHLGEINGLTIPYPEQSDEDFVEFNSIVENWLQENLVI